MPADPNRTAINGITPLYETIEMMTALLDRGAGVNAVDHEGNTALHNAAARGDVEMILYLVGKGADPKAINREGKMMADMANGPVQRIQPWPEALALLEKLGAVNNHRCP